MLSPIICYNHHVDEHYKRKGGGFMRIFTKNFIDILNIAEFPDFVEKIILFGSEVYGQPTVFSDIDLAIITKIRPTLENKVFLDDYIQSFEPPCECNLTWVNNIKDIKFTKALDVRKNILTKGVVIYDRENIYGY